MRSREEMYRTSKDDRPNRYDRVIWESENGESFPVQKDFFSRNYKYFIMVPFTLILLGVLIMAISEYPNPPDPDSYGDSDNYRDALDNYNNIVGDIRTTGELFFTLAIISLSFLFLTVPFLENKLSPVIKIAMMAIGVILMTHFLSGGFNLSLSLG